MTHGIRSSARYDQAAPWSSAELPAVADGQGFSPGQAAGLTSRRGLRGSRVVSRAAAPRLPLLAGNGAGVWVVLLIGWGLAAAAWLAWLAARIAARCPAGRMPAVRRPVGHQPGPLAHRPGVARHAHPPGRADRRRAGVRGHHGRGHRVAGHRRAHPQARRPGRGALRRPADPPLTPVPAARTAIRLRPSLAGRSAVACRRPTPGCCSATSSGPSGRGPALFASWEDTILAFMAPRVGQDHRAGHPLRAVRARRRSSPPPTRPTCGPPPRSCAPPRQHGLAVRPAADHRLRPALVVEPARRAGTTSRRRTGWPPTSS